MLHVQWCAAQHEFVEGGDVAAAAFELEAAVAGADGDGGGPGVSVGSALGLSAPSVG